MFTFVLFNSIIPFPFVLYLFCPSTELLFRSTAAKLAYVLLKRRLCLNIVRHALAVMESQRRTGEPEYLRNAGCHGSVTR